MEILNVNLPANGTVQMRKAGSYIEILSSSGPVNITLWTPSGGTTSSMKGALSGLYLNADFGAMDVIDASGVAQTVQLLVCDAGERGGSRRQPGNVNVIDNSASRTMADALFSGSYSVVANASCGSAIILGANGGGLKRLAVRSIIASSALAGKISLYIGSIGGTLTPAAPLRSKYVQAASSSLSGTARANAFQPAAASPSGSEVSGIMTWFGTYLPGNTPTQCVQGSAPIVLENNRLLVVSAESLNRDISVWFDVEEF